MAEAIGLAASLVGIASAGVSVVSKLTKFGISLRGSSDKINSLAGRVSLTASILSDIAMTVEQNASGFKEEEFWRTWRKVLQSCEGSYQKLEKALKKARNTGNAQEKAGKEGVSVWRKLIWALGGEAEMQDLETSLERCCQQVMMMQQAVQMSVLSLIARRSAPLTYLALAVAHIFRQKLSSDEIEDQRELMSKLQWLLTTLSEAGVLPAANTSGKVIVIDELQPDQGKVSTPARRRPKVLPGQYDSAAIASSSSATLQNTPKGLNLESSEAPLDKNRSFGVKSPSGLDFGLGLFNVYATQAPPPTQAQKARRQPQVTPLQGEEQEERQPPDIKDYFFEAFYIIPRSVPRAQPRGQLQLTKPVPDDYMILCLDTKLDYRKDPNLRDALRKAKRAGTANASVMDDFPRSVRQAALSLVSHKKRHAHGLNWSLVEGIQLQVLENSMFRKSSSKSGFLIIFRGTILQPSTRREDSQHYGVCAPPLSPEIIGQPPGTRDRNSSYSSFRTNRASDARVHQYVKDPRRRRDTIIEVERFQDSTRVGQGHDNNYDYYPIYSTGQTRRGSRNYESKSSRYGVAGEESIGAYSYPEAGKLDESEYDVEAQSENKPTKGILHPPRKKIPEESLAIRESVAPLKPRPESEGPRRRRRSRESRRQYRHESRIDLNLGMVQYGTEPVYSQAPSTFDRERVHVEEGERPKYRERLGEKRRKAVATPRVFQSRLGSRSSSQIARRASIATAALGPKGVKSAEEKSREKQEAREIVELQAKAEEPALQPQSEAGNEERIQRERMNAQIIKQKEETRKSWSSIAERNSVSQPPRIPGDIKDDLDFVATVAAGLQDTGFNQDIIISDSSFRRRDSRPKPASYCSRGQMRIIPARSTGHRPEVSYHDEDRDRARRKKAQGYERRAAAAEYGHMRSISPARTEISDATMSDIPSGSEVKVSTLMEDQSDRDALHLSQQEAQAMMMSFLATFLKMPA